ncbi:MAG: PDZ domain-containing protein [Bacilli bacterium]|nr:PDZ domain-containing protein [Bacilli bacterium]
MLYKLYEQIIKIIKNNYMFIIGFLIGFALITIKLPYYINTPGGSSDISSKIEIADHKIEKDTFKMAYVYEMRATIPTLIYSYFNKNWDVIKKEEVILPNEDKKDAQFRDHLMLKEANQQAIMLAYTKAKKEVKILNKKFYVTYVDEIANTDLKIGDEILKVNGQELNELDDINKISQTFVENEDLTIQIKRDNKIINKKATVVKDEDRLIIGILISVDQEIETNPKIELKFKETDGGPSGGFMMSLAIYDALTNSNLSQGRKIVGTGTIDSKGNVGAIGGAEYKIKGAVKDKADIFFVPAGNNYEEVMNIKNEKNYDIKIVAIETLDDAIEYLENN